MTKVAKLVTITLTTRVVVSPNATDEEIVVAATPGIIAKIHNNEMQENVTIEDDLEMPYSLEQEEPLMVAEADEDFSLDYKNLSQLSYLDELQKDSHVEIYLDDEPKALLEVWTDRENENREYVLINHEMIYLDTIQKR